MAVLASCRKGSGVLPAGRLAGLRCFTIWKAKGKNKKKSSRPAAILLIFYSFNPLILRYPVVWYGCGSRKEQEPMECSRSMSGTVRRYRII
ncbi:hypothetical protein ABEY41_23215 [Peribacillus butanolivorans]|uniref:hypothetical protein n=1 Tax=Peribacillus butanolivorans TaxID=421767 RepID=UPI003D27AA51